MTFFIVAVSDKDYLFTYMPASRSDCLLRVSSNASVELYYCLFHILTAIASKDLVIIAISMLIATIQTTNRKNPNRTLPVSLVMSNSLLSVLNEDSSVRPKTEKNRLAKMLCALKKQRNSF